MSKDKAAKKKTMSDVSRKPNVDGLYSSIQSDGETWDEIIKIRGPWKLNEIKCDAVLRSIKALMHIGLLE